jgi:hypothetical protein
MVDDSVVSQWRCSNDVPASEFRSSSPFVLSTFLIACNHGNEFNA